jgi:hypothetical protein
LHDGPAGNSRRPGEDLHYLEARAILKSPGTTIKINPLLPKAFAFRTVMLPNTVVRSADDVLTIDDFPPELVEAIRNAPRFEMFGPESRSPGRPFVGDGQDGRRVQPGSVALARPVYHASHER